jgi:hypothetical protein
MVVPAELPVFVWVEVETLRWAQEQQVVVKARQVGWLWVKVELEGVLVAFQRG